MTRACGSGWGSGWPPAASTQTSCGPQGQPHPHPPLIIGVGNRFRGDDGVGVLAAELLRERLGEGGGVVVNNGDAASLTEQWEGAESVIVVDAMSSGRPPGTVVCHDAAAQPLPVHTFASSSHAFGLAEAVELSRALGTLPSQCVIYGVELGSSNLGEDLSPAAPDSCPDS